MKTPSIILALASLVAMCGCNNNSPSGKSVRFDWDNNDRIEYAVDYTVSFSSDHDSTMQVTATGNRGIAKVVRLDSEELVDADGKSVKNTFILLEDSIPMGKSITLRQGDLAYGGGSPVFPHVQTVGSDDMVEFRILDTNAITRSYTNAFCTPRYSIRDNMFFGPDGQQQFTIPGGHRFSILLPVMTEARYPKAAENHTIGIAFGIEPCGDK